MSRSREIDRQESFPDCPNCGHNVFVHPGTRYEWICEGCGGEWGAKKFEQGYVPMDPEAHPKRDVVVDLLQETVGQQGSPTYVRAAHYADTIGMSPQELGRLLAALDVDGLELTKDTPASRETRATRWKLEVVDDGE